MAIADRREAERRARGLVPGAEMAEIIDLSPAALGALKRGGVLETAEAGWWDAKGTIRAYIRYLRKRNEGAADAADLNEEYLREKIQKTRADRRRAEVALETELGRLIPWDRANEDGRRVGARIHAAVAGLAGKLPPLLAGLDEVRIEAALKTETRAMLATLADAIAGEVYPEPRPEPAEKKKAPAPKKKRAPVKKRARGRQKAEPRKRSAK